jgi:hypothetical protein
MGKALKIIEKLEVKQFEWKGTDEPDIGLIAEEVEKVLPEAIWKKDGKIMGLKPLTLIGLIIKAIQELGGRR